jgi:NADPH:quinone reductase-like Zn-dependent oxidoreductase
MRFMRSGVQPLMWAALVACSDGAEGQVDAPAGAPQQMQAVRIHEFGAPSVLTLEAAPRPVPGPGELLVRVHAAAINPVDTGARAGRAPDFVHALPYTPGFDVSGVVAEVGDGVSRFAPGDAVFAMLHLRRGGGYAEYAIVRESEATEKPANISHAEAASLPLVALTVWQAFFGTADLQPGQTVLIHAGAGGVGTVAIQIAKWRGAWVIATASPHNHEFLRELGADLVIDYNTQRFEDVARDVDLVLDPIGEDTQVRSLQTLRDGGSLVGLMGLTGAARSAPRGIHAEAILVEPHADQLARIAKLVAAGHLRPVVSHLLPLADAAEAHVQSETRSTRGKIVLEVRP